MNNPYLLTKDNEEQTFLGAYKTLEDVVDFLWKCHKGRWKFSGDYSVKIETKSINLKVFKIVVYDKYEPKEKVYIAERRGGR